ncbi:MAG TPA: hypothetical protein VMR41_04555 [Patescibacteria group bacterium]|nr:hypothetical protein [Patescibacteria group bacterium]
MQLIKMKVTNKREKANYKVLEVSADITLYKFAEIIVKRFGFYFDHSFGFYDNLEDHFKSKEIYELFTDLDDVEHTPGAKGVRKYYFVSDLFKNRKKMLFLFDYGDTWEFILEVLDDSQRVQDVPKNYYKLYESHGEDPEQYPDIEDEVEEKFIN